MAENGTPYFKVLKKVSKKYPTETYPSTQKVESVVQISPD